MCTPHNTRIYGAPTFALFFSGGRSMSPAIIEQHFITEGDTA